MKRKVLAGLVIFTLVSGISLVGCDGTEDGTSNVNFEDQRTGYLLKIQNNTDKRLVAFKGLPNPNNLIGGIPAYAQNHGLPKSSALFSKTESFVLFVVTEEDYNANKANITALVNRPFTRIFAFYNNNSENNLVYSINDILGGSCSIIVNNDTNFNVELRLNGVNEEVGGTILGYAGAGMANTEFRVDEGNYMVFPVFRKWNEARGTIFTFFPRIPEGQPGAGKIDYATFSLNSGHRQEVIDAHKYLNTDIEMKTGCAYLIIQNNHSSNGLEFRKGGTIVTTPTGGQYINRTDHMIFTILMPKLPGASMNDDFLNELKLTGFSIGTTNHQVSLESHTFITDTIYQVIVSGINAYDVNLSSIVPVGTVKWSEL